MTTLDPWLPRWDFRERHERRIAAPPDRVYAALPDVNLGDSPFVKPLLQLRMLPARLAGRAPAGGIDLEQLTMRRFVAGFVELSRDPPRSFVVGACGAFWRPVGGASEATTPDAFASHARPGTARLAWGYFFASDGDGTLVVTETRIDCVDAAARRAMLAYWCLIRGPSGLIRRETLRLLARAAERRD